MRTLPDDCFVSKLQALAPHFEESGIFKPTSRVLFHLFTSWSNTVVTNHHVCIVVVDVDVGVITRDEKGKLHCPRSPTQNCMSQNSPKQLKHHTIQGVWYTNMSVFIIIPKIRRIISLKVFSMATDKRLWMWKGFWVMNVCEMVP